MINIQNIRTDTFVVIQKTVLGQNVTSPNGQLESSQNSHNLKLSSRINCGFRHYPVKRIDLSVHWRIGHGSVREHRDQKAKAERVSEMRKKTSQQAEWHCQSNLG